MGGSVETGKVAGKGEGRALVIVLPLVKETAEPSEMQSHIFIGERAAL
jgi:hypothetical protein